jgi:exodeoxyribonuclease III
VLTIITWNVNGVRARQSEVLDLLEREKPDVLCLQEIKASAESIPASLGTLPDHFGMWHGHKGYSGVSLHISRSLAPSAPAFDHPRFDHETRIVQAELENIIFVSTYVPNGGKDFPAKQVFLTELDAFAAHAEQAGKQLVVCGDLNVAREPRDVHPTLQKPEQIGQTPGERSQLERLIGRDLVDLSRQFYPDDDRLFSWWAPWRNMRQKNIGWRLDYVLCTRSLAAKATECTVLREFGTSDHAPVRAKFDIELPRYAYTPATPAPEPEVSGDRDSQLNLFDA